MTFKNRNLLLFFEENEDPNNISSNLVRLFMNRLTIEEEKRYEIIGTFNLSKVLKSSTCTDRRMNNFFHKDYIFDDVWRIHSDKMFKINWPKDRRIISNAFDKTFRMHIVIGTSIYMDHIEKVLGKKKHSSTFTLLNGWKKDLATKNQVRQCYFDSKKKYRYRFVNHNNPIYTSSVNDDFENLTSRIFKPHKFFTSLLHFNPDLLQLDPDLQQLRERSGSIRERPEYPSIPPEKIRKLSKMVSVERNSIQERVKTFLYKMLNDDEIDTQQSKEFEFMRSDCERLTVSANL